MKKPHFRKRKSGGTNSVKKANPLIKQNVRGIKQSNEYAQLLNNYDQIPKSVLAAIAISALTCGGDHLEKANEAIHEEWTALYDAQIVPQKPIKPEAK